MKKRYLFSLVLILVCIVLSAQKIHIVKKGDTLWDLAGYYYDNPFIWRNIYNANLDKIDDPHWIYPGQEFIIPDIPADAVFTITEDVTDEVYAEEEITTDERAPAELMVTKEEDSKTVTYSKMTEEETVTQIKEIREDIKKIEKSKSMKISNVAQYAVAEKFAFRAGYITPDNPFVGRLGDLYRNSLQYTKNEKVYMRIEDESPANLINKELIIYRWNNSVSSGDNEYLGKHVNILGTIRVDGFEGDLAYGTITGAFDLIEKNDYIAYYKAPTVPLNNAYLRETDDIRAALVDQADEMRINEYSIVFVDKGKESMINHGDVFTVVRKDKTGNYYAAGALQVLVPYDGYSTAYMMNIKGNTDIKPKEEVKLSYRNKSSYLINQYKKLSDMEGSSPTVETEIIMEEEIEEPVIEEVSEEEIIMEEEPVIGEEEIIVEEEPVIVEEEIIMEEEPVVVEEEIIVEEEPVVVEEEIIVEEEPVVVEEEVIMEEEGDDEFIILEDDEFIIEEDAVSETDDGFIIEEDEADTVYEDSFIIEGEDEIIIIEE